MFGDVAPVNVDIKPITEDVFDTSDNLFVFFLDNHEELMERQEDIQRIIRALMGNASLHRLRYYHNIKKEGDPPMPGAGEPSAGEQGANGMLPLRCVMYKGQRKGFLRVGAEVPLQEVLDFFAAQSEELSAALKQLEVPRVSVNSFVQDIVAKSSPKRPILLQMYEDTCFLCFLMRPFVNSLARIFSSHEVPLVVKRLNIEKNDFPDGCPVARGTPTFVLFRGAGVPPEKWEEFKPKDLVERLSKAFPHSTGPLFEQMDELQGMVSKRFQLFTQLVMWTIELQKLEKLVASVPLNQATVTAEAAGGAGAGGGAAEAVEGVPDPQEDAAFNALVSEMMAKDMKRVDGIVENLKHLQGEVDEVEHDAALMGAMLAEAVLRREKEEEELWAVAAQHS